MTNTITDKVLFLTTTLVLIIFQNIVILIDSDSNKDITWSKLIN